MGNDPQPADDLRLFHTGEHPCGYWPDRVARDLVLDPRDPRLPQLYQNMGNALTKLGKIDELFFSHYSIIWC